MPYQVFWDIPDKALCLELSGDVPLSVFMEIDQHITGQLEESGDPILLIVDAFQANITAHGIERIRASQSYLQSSRIRRLFVLTDNKVTRLAVMLLFNLCRPSLQFFSTPDQMRKAVDRALPAA